MVGQDPGTRSSSAGRTVLSGTGSAAAGASSSSPNVSWLIQFDTAVQWVLRIDKDNPSRSTLIRHIDVNRDFHSPTQFNSGCDQSAMKADDDGLAIARLTLSTT